MAMNQDRRSSLSPPLWLGAIGILLGIVVGILANVQPLYLGLVVVAVVVCVYFFRDFEQTLLGLLILRSTLDAFSAQQLPAAFALGLDVLAVLYVAYLLISRQKVQTDGFWWFLVGWVALQGLWVILLPLGGLGLNEPEFLAVGLREWFRVSAGVTVYLLVMQLKDRIPPQKIVSALFYSLIVPLIAATLQATVPPYRLPKFLVFTSGYAIEAGSRMNGTLGHPNVFATFLVLFISLTLWKIGQVKQRLPWLILLGALVFFLVSTKSLTGLVMLFALVPAFVAPKLNLVNFIGGILIVGLVLGFFASSDLGHERLQSLYGTPLLNPDISVSRAIFLQWFDGNSFNWRIAQWTFLLDAWRQSPLLGYGLDTSRFLTVHASYSHNDYVRFLAEEGIVGFILFLVFLVAQFVRLIQLSQTAPPRSPKRSLCYALLAFLTAMIVGMLSGNIWNHTTLFFYFWTLMAVLGWDWEQPVEAEPEWRSPPKFRPRVSNP
jgi:O-antigen ligase